MRFKTLSNVRISPGLSFIMYKFYGTAHSTKRTGKLLLYVFCQKWERWDLGFAYVLLVAYLCQKTRNTQVERDLILLIFYVKKISPWWKKSLCIRSYDTGSSFEPIFMKFTWLVRAHSWVNPIVFGNNRPNRTTDMGENVPPKLFFRVQVRQCGIFWEKNLKTVSGTPYRPKKGYMRFLSSNALSPQKWSCPIKIIFYCYFGKFVFSSRKSC